VSDDAAPSRPQRGGSCSCLCPPGRGFGFCYDMPRGVTDCSSMLGKAADDCPRMGVARQCHESVLPEDENCSALEASIRGDIGSTTVWGGHMTCSLLNRCSQDDLPVATCQCQAHLYGIDGCSWSALSCKHEIDGTYIKQGSAFNGSFAKTGGRLRLAQEEGEIASTAITGPFLSSKAPGPFVVAKSLGTFWAVLFQAYKL